MNIRPLTALLTIVLTAVIPTDVFTQQQAPDVVIKYQHNLMPVPTSAEFHDGKVPITDSLKVVAPQYTDGRLQAGIDRFLKRLQGRTGLTLGQGSSEGSIIEIRCSKAGETIPALDEDESYDLDISPSRVLLTASTVVGALRGLETILQLIGSSRDGYYFPAVKIKDQPRFRWRGLLIDIGRHYEPPEVLKRNLDAMAAVKLNVFHWHLTEDQGFRIESKKFPKLHQMGSDGLFYTQEQAKEIIEYARQRGIRVVPEFDIPGHSTSWLVGHPELGSAPGPYKIERQAGIFEPALDPTREDA